MSYVSPFGAINSSDHNGPDALCLSRTHCMNADEDTIAEFYSATVAAIERQAPQPAFFLARHLAELSLKALHEGTYPTTHNLTKLLASLRQQSDDLLSGGTEQAMLVAFINDLNRHDAGGDQGRYPTTRDGSLSLASVCCADPALLRAHVDRLHHYVLNRLAARRTGTSANASAPSVNTAI